MTKKIFEKKEKERKKKHKEKEPEYGGCKTQRSRNLCVDCATTPWIFVSQNTIVHTHRERSKV